MNYHIHLKRYARCDRTSCMSLTSIAVLVLLLFYIGSSYIPPGAHSLYTHDFPGSLEVATYELNKKDVKHKTEHTESFYGIIFDAGSTGTRLHVFELRKSAKDGTTKLVKETFKAVKPGLSSYYLHPKQGVIKTVKPLMDLASRTVPLKYHKTTPIALKATAGLRLLPPKAANDILREVRLLFKEYDFLYHNNDGDISIMDGTDEGIYMWVTVNFLLGGLMNREKAVAAFDLGGGSTQVTFLPKNSEAVNRLSGHGIHKITLFNNTFNLYTHSYLGLGLMTSRLYNMGYSPPSTTKSRDKDGINAVNNILKSPCLPANYIGNWSVQGTDFIIKGLQENEACFENCYKRVKSYVKHKNITFLTELQSSPLYLFSYYYDRAVDAKIIANGEGASVTTLDFMKAAKQICGKPSAPKRPFLCFDITYIYSLLTDGFGVLPNTLLHIYKSIDNVEMSWALGAMFDLISSHQETHRS